MPHPLTPLPACLPPSALLPQFTPDQVVSALRKHSKGGSSVQTSIFRGVTRHQKGRWEARIGQQPGRRYQYLVRWEGEGVCCVPNCKLPHQWQEETAG